MHTDNKPERNIFISAETDSIEHDTANSNNLTLSVSMSFDKQQTRQTIISATRHRLCIYTIAQYIGDDTCFMVHG